MDENPHCLGVIIFKDISSLGKDNLQSKMWISLTILKSVDDNI